MQYLFVVGWNHWQSYRKDRGTPPWIKVHRQLMTSVKWASLSDAEKGQLVCIWIAAADKSGRIPADPTVVRKICMLDDIPNIKQFIDLGYLSSDCRQLDATATPERRHDDEPETETETETEHTSGADAPDVLPGVSSDALFEQAREIYPSRPNDSRKRALKAWNARIRAGAKPADLLAGVERYARYVEAEQIEPRFVKHMATFLGPDEHWAESWAVAGKVPKDIDELRALVHERGIELPDNCKLKEARKHVARQTGMQL